MTMILHKIQKPRHAPLYSGDDEIRCVVPLEHFEILEKEITKLKEALREAVEVAEIFRREFGCEDFDSLGVAEHHAFLLGNFLKKHAAIIEEVRK